MKGYKPRWSWWAINISCVLNVCIQKSRMFPKPFFSGKWSQEKKITERTQKGCMYLCISSFLSFSVVKSEWNTSRKTPAKINKGFPPFVFFEAQWKQITCLFSCRSSPELFMCVHARAPRIFYISTHRSPRTNTKHNQ